MINNRLDWYLERNKILSKMQCGFRRQHSTNDHLVCLESFVREAFAQQLPLECSLQRWRKRTKVLGSLES